MCACVCLSLSLIHLLRGRGGQRSLEHLGSGHAGQRSLCLLVLYVVTEAFANAVWRSFLL